ncbi:unnamed protein product, partial [Allacma fusca]
AFIAGVASRTFTFHLRILKAVVVQRTCQIACYITNESRPLRGANSFEK